MIPGLGRSPGGGNGYPFQYSCLENSTDTFVSSKRLPDWASLELSPSVAPDTPGYPEGKPRVPAPPPLSPFSPPDRDRRVDCPAWSGRGSQPSRRTRSLENSAAAAAAKSLQSCLILSDPMDCSLPGSSVHGILQARILEWVAMPSSRGSSQPRD